MLPGGKNRVLSILPDFEFKVDLMRTMDGVFAPNMIVNELTQLSRESRRETNHVAFAHGCDFDRKRGFIIEVVRMDIMRDQLLRLDGFYRDHCL